MRKVEVTADQVAEFARKLAHACQHHDPDVPVVPGEQAQRIALPFGVYRIREPDGCAFPLWQALVPLAELALAQAGALAGVEFVKLTPQPLGG